MAVQMIYLRVLINYYDSYIDRYGAQSDSSSGLVLEEI